MSTARVEYMRWPGPKLSWHETYGKTPIVGADGERTCAEVAIVVALRSAGWEAYWIDTFGQAPTVWRPFISVPGRMPAAVRERFETIESGSLPSKPGRWDIVAWRQDEIVILESKGAGDAIRPGQATWLKRALELGALPLDSFGIVNYVVKH